MDKIKWIIATVIFLILIALAMFSGYHLKKCPECPEIQIKDSTYTIPMPPQTAHLEIKKKATPSIDSSSITLQDYAGGNYQAILDTSYAELIDTTIIFQNDSLDFIADINFSTKTQEFMNFFQFNLRATEKIKKAVKEVLVPMKPEIYQMPFVIGLIAAVMFLFGLAL